MDEDLERLGREALIAEVKRLRQAIREHRDSSGHDLCWHHPQLWGLLPERVDPEIAVPPWPRFLRGCVRYANRSNGSGRTRRRTIANSSLKSYADRGRPARS